MGVRSLEGVGVELHTAEFSRSRRALSWRGLHGHASKMEESCIADSRGCNIHVHRGALLMSYTPIPKTPCISIVALGPKVYKWDLITGTPSKRTPIYRNSHVVLMRIS